MTQTNTIYPFRGTIEPKRLVAALLQGAELTASRVMPFPHDYRITTRGDAWAVRAEHVIDLVESKVIVGTPQDSLWDRIDFHVVDRDLVRRVALTFYPNGFGYCPMCGEILALRKGEEATLAVRHGAKRGGGSKGSKEATAPCAGSGVPVSDAFLPSSGVAHAA